MSMYFVRDMLVTGTSWVNKNKGVNMAKAQKKARDAKSGQYVTLHYAKKHPSTTVVETVKKRK